MRFGFTDHPAYPEHYPIAERCGVDPPSFIDVSQFSRLVAGPPAIPPLRRTVCTIHIPFGTDCLAGSSRSHLVYPPLCARWDLNPQAEAQDFKSCMFTGFTTGARTGRGSRTPKGSVSKTDRSAISHYPSRHKIKKPPISERLYP